MESEVNGRLIVSAVKKYAVWILAVTALCGVIAFCLTLFMPPVYSSTSSFYVTNIQIEDNFTQSALVSAAQSLGKGYIEIIKSDRLLEEAAKTMDSCPATLRKYISGKVESNSEVFTVTVKSHNKDTVNKLMTIIASDSPTVIDQVARRDNCVALLTQGEAVKIGPSKVANTLIGAAVGAVVSFIVFIFITMADRTVRTEEDIKNHYSIPVVGSIPRWINRGGSN